MDALISIKFLGHKAWCCWKLGSILLSHSTTINAQVVSFLNLYVNVVA